MVLIVNRSCLDNTYHFHHFVFFLFFLLLYCEKRSSLEHLLEHYEACDTKIIMRGPIVRQLCVGRSEK